jgi:hypothetical protein
MILILLLDASAQECAELDPDPDFDPDEIRPR